MQMTPCFTTTIRCSGVTARLYLTDSGNLAGKTHSDAFVLAADSHVVAFPEHGGLRVSTRRHALQHRRLAGSHHHIAGCLSEIVSQD